MKTEFLANISHELRTPLNVMLSGLQLLEMHKNKGDIMFKDEELMEKAYYVKQNGYRLLRLINNLIDVTKIDSGFFHLQLETKNIVEVIEDITLSIGEYMKQKGINLIFDTNEEELYISIDTDKIERIMLNLLSNAIKFTPEDGTILVTVNCSDHLVKVSVKDDGIGIPRAMQKEIFNRFTQVDSSLHRNKQGSGIGLSLVKSLVELHKGKIYVESLEGKGSTFTFELPVAKGKENPEAAVTSLDGDKSAYNEKIVLEFSDIHESNTF
ncbi:Sensor histidine kinase WalK [bioreactor metagenome]|uniref:histidine kinase n=1 Tax=bioreactor metagenome TaxID=1076179 RepID=A0A645E974_9ZZZZ